MSQPSQPVDGAVIIRRLLFFLVLLGLTLVHLLILFRGLDTPQAMDQAQIGRQVARGEGLTTQFIRPLEHHIAEQHEGSPVPFVDLRDTYHAPLNPLVLGAVFKLVGADDAQAWGMEPKELIYPLDRVVALVSTLFFLMSMGVTYLLVSRVFDGKIAGVTALLMLLCDLFWRFSQSGLPQMLLLLLFTCGLYFAYRAVEYQEQGRSPVFQAMIGSLFFALMVLTHWIGAWPFFGFLIFAALAFRPRGVVALSALGVLLVAVVPPMVRMAGITGQPFGVARFVFYNGLAGGSESLVMRTQDLGDTPFTLDGLLLKILGTTLVQATELIPFFGGIIAAPIFFVALLHPFKRTSIAQFRWLILLMWGFAAIGMAIFGIDREENAGLHPNQIHLLFAPIMAAYGLAFVSILWSRLEAVATVPALRNAHYIAIVAFSAAPMVLSLPKAVRNYMAVSDRGGWPQWPPYFPQSLNRALPRFLNNDPAKPEIVVSDQPWAVAWYADTHSIWLPKTMEDFKAIDAEATDFGTRLMGMLITPSSRDATTTREITQEYGAFTPLILDGRVASAVGMVRGGRPFSIYEFAPTIEPVSRRFPNRYSLFGASQEIMLYTENVPRDGQEAN